MLLSELATMPQPVSTSTLGCNGMAGIKSHVEVMLAGKVASSGKPASSLRES